MCVCVCVCVKSLSAAGRMARAVGARRARQTRGRGFEQHRRSAGEQVFRVSRARFRLNVSAIMVFKDGFR